MSRAAAQMLIAAFVVSLLGGVACAQDSTMDVLREKVRADKKLVVAVALDLADSEAGAFWPVYNAYQSDMVTHYDGVRRLLETYASAYQSMTDETAAQLLRDYLALETNQVALMNSYAPRFQRVLPPKKVARLYQIENKIRALVNYELAREIPLIK